MKPRLDSIYLVANLAGYDFGNVVLLADDVAAIATVLAELSDADCVAHCEQLLFLGHVLARALEASRRVVRNFEELEELLRVNWADGGRGAERRWSWVREKCGRGMLNRVARRILAADGGEVCVGIVRAFYRKYSEKREFRKVIGEVTGALVWRESAEGYLGLRARVEPEVGRVLGGLEKLEDCRGEEPEKLIKGATRWNLPALVSMHGMNSLQAVREMFKDDKLLEKYQDLTKFKPFYVANLELLKSHQRILKNKDILYDSNTILLCHLIYQKHQPAQFLEDFLNPESVGGSANLELILAELQNFAG
ncbi:hypothetical protein quinque_015057 [Culex quinquefasciatus]